MTSDRTEKLAGSNFWDLLFALRDKQRAQNKGALQVVKGAELPLESNRNGLMRWYLHPEITDTALTTLMFYMQEIPSGSRSGRIKCQGGQVMLILKGKGYTTIDGVKHHWDAGDVVNLPLRYHGILVQHFNGGTDLVKFVIAEPNWFASTTVDRGSGFEQIENSPDFKG